MEGMLHTPVSGLHLAAALLAVVLGGLILWLPKPVRLHRQLGAAYSLCMLVVSGTALQIFELFGRFGIVHWGAVVSLGLLAGGIGLAIWRPRRIDWRFGHRVLMGASVTGLVAAGLVESTYRLVPRAYFWEYCLGVPFFTFLIGGLLLFRKQTKVYTRSTPVRRAGRPIGRKKIAVRRIAR